jgi:site-specific recombinase XerD
LEESSAKSYHGQAVKKLTLASAVYEAWAKQESKADWIAEVEAVTKLDREYLDRHSATIQAGWKGFEPYCLRHSALTMLAESGCDAFTLARIAGHSSITITQRYCHPQADAIERAFGKFSGGHKIGYTQELAAKSESSAMAASDS